MPDGTERAARAENGRRDQHQTGGWRSTLKSVLAVGLAALSLAGAAALAQSPEKPRQDPAAQQDAAFSPAEALNPAKIGQMRRFVFHNAPQEIEPISLFGAEGELRDFSEFEGKIVLVNFWALWCPPCVEELPSLDRLAARVSEELGEDVVVVGVNVDRGDAGRPLSFMQTNGVEHLAFLHDPSFAAALKLNVRGMPTTLLLDRRGRELGRFIGATEWDSAEVMTLLERAAALP